MKIYCGVLKVMIWKVTFSVMLLTFINGCTTTQQSRDLALALSTQLDVYIKDRREAINSLNQSYRSTYVVLLGEQRELSMDRLTLEREASARMMADAIMLNWVKKTTFSSIAEELKVTRGKQLLAMENRAEGIASARRQYVESYSELQLDLNKLIQAKRNLADLSEGENTSQRTLELLIMIGKAYNNVREEESR